MGTLFPLSVVPFASLTSRVTSMDDMTMIEKLCRELPYTLEGGWAQVSTLTLLNTDLALEFKCYPKSEANDFECTTFEVIRHHSDEGTSLLVRESIYGDVFYDISVLADMILAILKEVNASRGLGDDDLLDRKDLKAYILKYIHENNIKL